MKHDFVTIADLSKDKIMYMIRLAQEFEKHPNRELLKGKIVATLFRLLRRKGIERDKRRDAEGHHTDGVQLC